MQKVTSYKCPTCGMKYKSLQTWINHTVKQHPNEIPKGFTPAQYFYYIQTGKKSGSCIVCKKPTEWSDATGKYARFCNNPECKEKYREEFKKRMMGKYGKVTLLDDPEQQRKMLAAKKNSGKYRFSDGGEVEYVSTYELDFLKMLDTFLHLSSNDIMGPSPHTYYYTYRNADDRENEGKKFYIPDYYIPSLNLEIEIKQNTSTHPKILKIDKVKEAQKDEMMKSNKRIKYIKITDKDYSGFYNLLLSLREKIPTDDEIDKNIAMQPANESFNIPVLADSPKSTRKGVNEVYNDLSKIKSHYNKNTSIIDKMSITYKYKTQTYNEFKSSKAGLSMDYAIYAYHILKSQYKLDCRLFAISSDRKLMRYLHVFPVVSFNNKYIYIETFYDKISGIYIADSIEQICSYIATNMLTVTFKSPITGFYIVKPEKYCGLSIEEYTSKLNTDAKVLDINFKEVKALNKFNTLVEPATEGLTDIKEAVFNFFGIGSRPSEVVRDFKSKLFTSANLLGTPVPSKYVTLSKVLVDDKRGIISIQNINYDVLIRRIRETFGERRLDYIFDRTYKSKDITLYNKKKISRSNMRITSFTTPVFFALELTIIFNELYSRYRTPVYAHLSKQIYEKTWLSKADSAPVGRIDLSRLSSINKDYTLKDYQLQFIKDYPSLKARLNLNGYILAFDQGLGKSLTSAALAECLNVDKVYIVCPNTLTTVWKSELGLYFNNKYKAHICTNKDSKVDPNTKYFIVNNEGIKNMIKHADPNCRTMLIVDEIHNFRNAKGIRTNELIELKEKLKTKDILLMSGTPIKALPSEIVPALRLLDPMFTPHAAEIYASCFKFNSYLAMDIVTDRFANVIYRKTKDEVLQLPNKTISDLKFNIKNADKYTLKNVKGEVKKLFDIHYEALIKDNKDIRDKFKGLIRQYSMAGLRDTNSYLNKVLTISNDKNNVTKDSLHEIDQQFMLSFVDTYIATNPNIDKQTINTIKNYEKKLIFIRNSAMGKAVGAIYPKYRAEMFTALYEENKNQIIAMINSNDKKTVIFSQSLPVVKYICDDLNKEGIPTVKVVGGTSSSVRADIIDRFKYDESVRVIIATSQSMSTGVTLTCASQMFFFGTPFRSADFDQCCDRIYRIGQDVDVHIYNVLLNTELRNLSDRMEQILTWSKDMFDAAIGSEEIS